MADDFIKRKDAVANIADTYNIGYEYAEKVLRDIPAADVRPVVRGRWNFTGKNAYSTFFRCSICNELVDGKANFCPNCGAMMDEEG